MAGKCHSFTYIFFDGIFSKKKKNPTKLPSFCQVKSGTLFDNVLVSDDPEYAKKFAEETWGKNKNVCSFSLPSFFPIL